MMWEIIYIFLGIGVAFNMLGSLGLIRFPDVYTRLHSSTLATTFGFLFFALAVTSYLLIFGGLNFSLVGHIILIILILLTVEPCIAHAISRAAHKNGIKPKEMIIDELNNF